MSRRVTTRAPRCTPGASSTSGRPTSPRRSPRSGATPARWCASVACSPRRCGAPIAAGSQGEDANMSPPRWEGDLPAGLDFEPQPPVRWFEPRMLRKTGQQVALSKVFAGFSDKRELQAAQPAPFLDRSQGEELWLDYVCDLGDGFDATASVASVLTQPSVPIPPSSADGGGPAGNAGGPAPRGEVLVLGGDQVYPFASIQEYKDRLVGPYAAMFCEPELTGDAEVDRPATARGAARRGGAGQPRLVRRPHRLHPPVHAALHRLEAVAVAGGLEGGAAAELLRGEAAPALVAVGHRHPARHLHRQRAAGLVQGRDRPGGGAGRRHHPLLGQAVLGRRRPRCARGLRQPRLLRAQDHRAGPSQAPGRPDRRPPLLRALRVPRRQGPGRRAEDHRRRRRGLPGADVPPSRPALSLPPKESPQYNVDRVRTYHLAGDTGDDGASR